MIPAPTTRTTRPRLTGWLVLAVVAVAAGVVALVTSVWRIAHGDLASLLFLPLNLLLVSWIARGALVRHADRQPAAASPT